MIPINKNENIMITMVKNSFLRLIKFQRILEVEEFVNNFLKQPVNTLIYYHSFVYKPDSSRPSLRPYGMYANIIIVPISKDG